MTFASGSYDETLYTNPKGRLTTLSDSSGTTKSNYDSMGQITSSIKTIASDGSTYTTQTQYDALGRVKKIIYPDNAGVDYTYNGNGNIKDIRSGTQTYADYNSYNAVSSPLLVTYGNGVTTQYQYYTENNRLFSITTSRQSTGFMNLSYAYDNAGNITGITDYLDNTKTRTYVYDDLDRLTSATSTSYGGTLTWQYDKIGNMTYNSRYGNYVYGDPLHKHAVTQAGADTYTYDANGNMISGAGRTLTYD
jgi:YD repeat-containing protein